MQPQNENMQGLPVVNQPKEICADQLDANDIPKKDKREVKAPAWQKDYVLGKL